MIHQIHGEKKYEAAKEAQVYTPRSASIEDRIGQADQANKTLT